MIYSCNRGRTSVKLASLLSLWLYLVACTLPALAREFHGRVDYPIASGSQSAVIADLNGDGKPDLAAVDYYVASVSILLGNGDGTFQTHQDYGVGNSPNSIAAADFNADG